MNYIVLDMEWNQPCYGEAVLCKNGVCMKNEIIQIGAVKLSEDALRLSSFRKIIKPVSLTSMNKVIKQLTGITDEMLNMGESFEQVIESFRQWCGEDFVFLIWGYDDVRILKNNHAFHGLDDKWIPSYCNLQMIFCSQMGLERRQYALSFALDYLDITVDEQLHDALHDAEYTAKVCKHLDLKKGIENLKYMPSHEEKVNKGGVLVKRKFRHLQKREDIWANSLITRPCCPFCGEKMKLEKPKRIGSSKYHIEGTCRTDGSFMTVIKVCETPQKTFSVSQQIYILDENMREYFEKSKKRRTARRHTTGKKRKSGISNGEVKTNE